MRESRILLSNRALHERLHTAQSTIKKEHKIQVVVESQLNYPPITS